MLTLKRILQSKLFYLVLIIITIIYLILTLIIIKKESIYNGNETIFIGTITNIKQTNYGYSLTLKSKEKLVVYLDNCNYKLGDMVKIKGILSKPKNNTILNNFNYRKYLEQQEIYYLLDAKEIELIKSNKNIIYNIKNKLLKYMDSFKSKNYLKAFILGDTSYLNEIYTSYQINGVCHLLAIGSTHITLLNLIILKLFKKLKLKFGQLIAFLLIFLYLILTGFPISILRTFIFLLLSSINKKFKFDLSSLKLFLIVISLTLFINSNYIFNKGFLYSYYLSFILILFKEHLKGNKIIKLLKICFISFLGSLPFNIYFNYEINVLSIFYNLLFVPVFNIIIFPISLLTLIFSFLDNLFYQIMEILNQISIFLNQYSGGILIFKKMSIVILVIYLILIIFVLKDVFKKKYCFVILLLIVLSFHYEINKVLKDNYYMTIDVRQGDSSLLYLEEKVVLIDTGGLFNESITDKTILMLKSLGIRKIDNMILTHGDFDHMGETINLVNNFKVENVIFNCGEFNDLEKELIKVLDKKNIKYYSCIKELNVANNKIYFINNKDYENENDNSIVLYTELNDYKFLFMGDASVKTEKDILQKYNLKDIDVIKVGHHGSKTSSSEEFIDKINPKYSIISVGKNNRYNHPNSEVLEVLDNSKIYRTDIDGSIIFKIKNNKLDVSTCPP